MTQTTAVPFMGFYESLYSDIIETATTPDETDIAAMYGYSGDNPEQFLSDNNITFDYNKTEKWQEKQNFDYNAMCNKIATMYVEELAELTGVNLVFESLRSPREYNFSTDTIYAHIDNRTVRKLFAQAIDKLDIFQEVINERHTSRSGFISFYSNNINDWIKKPCNKYDHNEIETLLHVLLKDYDNWEEDIYQKVYERCISNGQLL